jgi:hypothetical protein
VNKGGNELWAMSFRLWINNQWRFAAAGPTLQLSNPKQEPPMGERAKGRNGIGGKEYKTWKEEM